MKKLINRMACCVLSVQATITLAQSTNAAKTNMFGLTVQSPIAASRSKYGPPPNSYGAIGTNTPAFEEYAVNFMLAQANLVREAWRLDIPKPLTAGDVLFWAQAQGAGVYGCIGTRDGRYNWFFSCGRMNHFYEGKYRPTTFMHHDDKSAELAKIKSQITKKEALKIAEDSLHGLGLSSKQLKLREPPEVHQYFFEESDGKKFPLPIFNVRWFDPKRPDYAVLTMDVSGITKQVAEYFNAAELAPRSPPPTNYLEMLGVTEPTNEMQRLGFKPWPRRETK